MEPSGRLCWNDFENNLSVAIRDIQEEKDFFDCTLSVGDRQLQAHKLILSACSPFFRSVLRNNPHQHPLLYLKGVEFSDLQSVLKFMYHGEVNVAQEDLNSFLAVAEDLKVKGLTNISSGEDLNTSPKLINKPKLRSPSQSSSSDSPLPKRPRPSLEQDDDEVLETEAEQLSVTPFQQEPSYPDSDTEEQVAAWGLTQEEDLIGIGEEDGYDYGVIEEIEEGAQEEDIGNHSEMEPLEVIERVPKVKEVWSVVKSSGKDNTESGKDKEDEYQYMGANSKKIEGGQYLCLICSKITTHSGNMKQHFTSHHWPGTVHENFMQGLPCQYCGRWFKNSNSLASHVSQNHKKERHAEKAGQVPGNHNQSPQLIDSNRIKCENSSC